MTLEELLQRSLQPLELDPEELQQLSESLQSLPARSIRRWLHLDSSHKVFFESLEPIAWHQQGFWWDEARGRPGAECLYAAGAYFIQDAASMLPITLLAPHPGELICDLCAAPGGKATAIAEALGDSGWLLANEAIQSRLAPLELNLARTGSDRYVTTNCDPEQLAQQLPHQFDAILVDAPCSGQTLIGKGKQSYSSMGESAIELNAARQTRILDAAEQLVRPGGRLVYSTCTLATAENEVQVESFLQRHPDWELVSVDSLIQQLGASNTLLAETLLRHQSLILPGCYRLWPHRDRCAGGFAALLRKKEGDFQPVEPVVPDRKSRTKREKRDENRSRFRPKTWNHDLPQEWTQWGQFTSGTVAVGQQQAFVWPDELPVGWLDLVHGGPEVSYKKGSQWFPAHALALRRNWKPMQSIELTDDETKRFMMGETVDLKGRNNPHSGDWCIAQWRQLPLGWLKYVDTIGKNHIPKPARLHLHST